MKNTFAFVLMPFDRQFDDIYKLGIKAACNDLSVYCERIDEQIFTESILDRIYNQIIKADIIIADMTGRNPNVFYETGFSHALQKKAILLTQNADDIPFDLKHYPHIVYGGSISTLKDELSKRIDWFVRNPLNIELPNVQDLEYYFSGTKLEDGCTITLNINNPIIQKFREINYSYSLIFQLDIFNPNNKLVNVKQQIAILTPNIFFANENENIKTIRLPDGKYLHISKYSNFEMYPLMWDFIKFELSGGWYLDSFKEAFVLKIHDSIGIREINFIVEFKGK